MRPDMSRVIVERPRRGGRNRPGRTAPLDEQPFRESLRRPHKARAGAKELNENLAPLRRYLESQVGRPWNKVYAEIAAHLRADNAVQQHVRDHIRDFVAIKPRRINGTYFTYPGEGRERFSYLWHQRLYVDEMDGILKRTDRLPEEKARRRRMRNRLPPPIDRMPLAADRELRRIDGFWYELRLAPMPEPVYRTMAELRRVPLKQYTVDSPTVEIEIAIRRLVSPPVRDVALGRMIEIGPPTDNAQAWAAYRREQPDRRYAIAKRRLCKAQLRRHGLQDRASDEIAVSESTKKDRLAASWRGGR